MKSFLVVALGGAAGTLARHGLAEAIDTPAGTFPTATFAVNVSGSFLLGALLAALLAGGDDSGRRRTTRLLLGTGVLGGYTTYSAFAVETDQLLRTGHAALALGYAAASVLSGAVAALVGVLAGRTVAR